MSEWFWYCHTCKRRLKPGERICPQMRYCCVHCGGFDVTYHDNDHPPKEESIGEQRMGR